MKSKLIGNLLTTVLVFSLILSPTLAADEATAVSEEGDDYFILSFEASQPFAVAVPSEVTKGEVIDVWFDLAPTANCYSYDVTKVNVELNGRGTFYNINPPRDCSAGVASYSVYKLEDYSSVRMKTGTNTVCATFYGENAAGASIQVSQRDCATVTVDSEPETCNPTNTEWSECTQGTQWRKKTSSNCNTVVETRTCDVPEGVCVLGDTGCGGSDGKQYLVCNNAPNGGTEWRSYGYKLDRCDVECLVDQQCEDNPAAKYCDNDEYKCSARPSEEGDCIEGFTWDGEKCVVNCGGLFSGDKWCDDGGIGYCVSKIDSCGVGVPDEDAQCNFFQKEVKEGGLTIPIPIFDEIEIGGEKTCQTDWIKVILIGGSGLILLMYARRKWL